MRRIILILSMLLAGVVAPSALADGSGYSTSILGHSPKSYWELGESSPPFSDSGSDGFSLTASSSGVTAGAAGPTGDANAVTFSGGSNVWLQTSYQSALNPTGGYTIEAWVYPTAYPSSTQNTAVIATSRPSDGSTKGYSLAIDYNHHPWMCVGDGTNFDCEFSTATIPLNQWSFIVGEVKHLSTSYEARVWVNGSPAGAYSFTAAPVTNTTGGFYVGNNYTGGKGFTGRIAQVVFNNPALAGTTISDDSSIVADYTAMATAPTNTATPSVSGTATIGNTLSSTNGTWTGSPLSYTVQWQRCDSSGANCADITGATSSSYSVTEADFGSTIRASVTASNAFGTTTSSSAVSAVVTDGSSGSWLARWDFNESSGSTAHDSIGSHDLSLAGGATLGSGYANFGSGSSAENDDYVFHRIASATIAGRFRIDNSGFRMRYLFSARLADFGGDSSNPVILNFYLARGYTETYNDPGNTSPISPSYSWGTDEYELVAFFGSNPCLCAGQGYLYAPHVTVTPNTWHTFAVTINGGQSDVALRFDGAELDTIYPYGSSTTSGASGGPGTIGLLVGNQYASGTDYYLGGDFDWLAIYGETLPEALVGPTISGTAQEGQTLTASSTWDGATSLSYQWRRCESDGASCSDISGATSSTYTLTSDDVGSTIRAEATATNAAGSTSAVSDPSSAVAPPPPVVVTPPHLTGDVIKGGTINITEGVWGNSPTSFSYAWQKCTSPTSCSSISDPGGAGLLLSDSDVGNSFIITVTATNASGSTSAEVTTPVVLDQATLDQLAFDYRPALLFDTSEHYRPITLDSFFAETSGGDPAHLFCDTTCDTGISSLSDFNSLADDASTSSFISIWPYSGDNSLYRSPACASDSFLRDCGDTPGIYYDYGQSVNGYRFLDYWFFYRYNPRANDQHEGDWEGVTVELDATPVGDPSVVGVVFSAHGAAVFRLASNVSFCGDGASTGDDCTEDAFDASHRHAADFVASGSHASYEYPCDDVIEGVSYCYNAKTQSNVPPLSENTHDGGAGWTDNSDDACTSDDCVRRLTDIDGTPVASWVTFPGKWGGSTGNVEGFGHSPDSPGSQTPFTCTQMGWDCDGLDGQSDAIPLGAAGAARVGATSPKPRPFVLGSCSNWYDGGLAAFACSQKQLSKAVAQHKLTKKGSFSLVVDGRHTGTAPGLVQTIGGPLPVGATVKFRGTPAQDEVVVVNCFTRTAEWAITLSHLRSHPGAAATLIMRRGAPALRLKGLTARSTIVRLTPGERP